MIATLAAFTLAMLTHSVSSHSDTTIAVRPPMRLTLNNFSGAIAVRTWSKNAIRIEADHSSRARLQVTASPPKLNIDIAQWRGIPSSVDYRLTVPKWMSLELSGVSTDIEVSGSQSEINVQSVSGDVSVIGGTGFVTAASVSGDVSVEGAPGKIECSSVESDVHVGSSSGAVAASSVNGDVGLKDIDSDDVEASTVGGGVTYDGTIKDGGSYKLSSTNGDLSIAVPTRANATVSISTYNGEFESEFPVTFTGTKHRKQFTFMIGSGTARIELESFQGAIQLRRPGSPSGSGFEYKYETKPQKKDSDKKKGKTHEGDEDEDHE